MSNLWIFLLFLIYLKGLFSIDNSQTSLVRKSKNRCEEICLTGKNISKDELNDCQRGCQYFNIGFLVDATDNITAVDINTICTKCESSCTEAYIQLERRSICHSGCQKMRDIQDSAPYVNGWTIYMGSSKRGMVLLRSDMKIESANDWILLESFLISDDYDYTDPDKLSEVIGRGKKPAINFEFIDIPFLKGSDPTLLFCAFMIGGTFLSLIILLTYMNVGWFNSLRSEDKLYLFSE